jgi:hypothetical protein
MVHIIPIFLIEIWYLSRSLCIFNKWHNLYISNSNKKHKFTPSTILSSISLKNKIRNIIEQHQQSCHHKTKKMSGIIFYDINKNINISHGLKKKDYFSALYWTKILIMHFTLKKIKNLLLFSVFIIKNCWICDSNTCSISEELKEYWKVICINIISQIEQSNTIVQHNSILLRTAAYSSAVQQNITLHTFVQIFIS